MLISPTEPPKLMALGKVSGVPERYGADVLISHLGATTGIQRKKFPEDLVASLADGRLYEQLPKLQRLDRALVVLEGRGRWTRDGELLDTHINLTRPQVWGLVFSIMYEFGVPVLWVGGIEETVEVIEAVDRWSAKPEHRSLRSRPGPKKDSWGKVGNADWARHLLQSFPGVGPKLAERVYEHLGVPMRWTVTEEEIQSVPGIGKMKAKRMWEALDGDRGGETDGDGANEVDAD